MSNITTPQCRGSLQEFDALSRGKWSLIEHGENVRGALVLYFHDSAPEELLTSGDYISFRDFKRVQRSMGVNDEPLAMLYHKLALYFVGISNPEFYEAAHAQLVNNPRNMASWNDNAGTFRYFLLRDMLYMYGDVGSKPLYKIPGFDKLGKHILRTVLGEEYFLLG